MQAATDTIILTDSTTPEKPKFDIQNVYETTLSKLKVKVSAITIRSSTLHLIIKYVMELVEQTPLKGSEQKEMALKLIRALIVDFTDAEDERVLLQLLDDGTIGNMIDLIVDATRGRLDINTAVQVTTGCLNRCLPYLCL
jgi:hypothetical protein|tara:strand:- start:791 stop:1210 length:420 start_codon:yes stop_codon:yes gene_type:complete